MPTTPPFDAAAFADQLSPFLQKPFDYWLAKRGVRSMPARADIDPVEMRAWLPQTLLAEPLADGDFRFRLVGTDVRNRLGREMTGRRLSELPVPADQLRILIAEYRSAVTGRAPTHHFHDHPKEHPGTPIRFGRLLLPLSADGETVDLLLGVRHDRLGDPQFQLPGSPQISLSRASRPQLSR